MQSRACLRFISAVQKKHIFLEPDFFSAAATQAKPQPFAARAKRENEKAKCFEGKGPEAQWSGCWSSRLKVWGSNPSGRFFKHLNGSAYMSFSWFPALPCIITPRAQLAWSCCKARFHSGKMFQVPSFYPHIDLAWVGSSPNMCEKAIFRSLKNCFSAKPKFSSSHWGKHCFRSPSLPTPHIDFAWIGSSPSMSEKMGAWKIVFLQSPISSRKTKRGHPPKKGTAQGDCKPHV